MSKQPVQFDELYRNLVRAGESSGSLETVLATIADYKENIETIKGKIKKAMFYPIAIIAVAIIVCGILLVYVVPIFKEQFASFGADLPAFTALVFGISDILVGWWWLMLGVALAAFFAFMYRSEEPTSGRSIDLVQQSQTTRETSGPARGRSRRRCSIRSGSSRWRSSAAASGWYTWCRCSRSSLRAAAPTCPPSPRWCSAYPTYWWDGGG